DGVGRGVAVQPRHIAVGVVKTHQPMHPFDGREAGIDRARERRLGETARIDLDEGAKQRPRAPHRLPFMFASYHSSARLTPSVTCREDSVAPLILVMSPLSCSGELALLPTNWARHVASRTS